MRFAFIARHRNVWPVSWLCEVLEVSRSGFHASLNRPVSARAIHDAKRSCPRGWCWSAGPSERSEPDQDATAGSLTVGLSCDAR